MNTSLYEKLYAIAEVINDLNSNGKVKGNPYHEYGYAKIHQVKRGCSFWIHHWNDDRLLIDLLISETAKKSYEKESFSTIESFKMLFPEKVMKTVWRHSDGKGKDHDHFYIDVSNDNFEEIMVKINKIKRSYT